MSRKKLQRHRELSNLPRCVDTETDWSELFDNQNPITLELACGRGEYTNGLAQLFPNRNFVGVDIKGERLWQGAQKSSALKLTNTAFLRASIDMLESYFEPQSINEIWIIHPDPQPNKPKKRLTHQKYLTKYLELLKPNGTLHLKTDDRDLFEFSLHSLQEHWTITHQTFDLHNSELLSNHHGILTNFETKALIKNKPIHYLSATKKLRFV